MQTNTPIFGLRFGSNSAIQPSREELDRFLDQPKGAGPLTQRQDLATYDKVLESLASFERERPSGHQHDGFRDRMFYGVLGHTSLFHASLRSAIEVYKYHLHAFQELDFRKPSSFITSAEEEIARLNPKKKRDAAKLARLLDMVAERKSMLAALTKQRKELSDELVDIARYVADNLERIGRRCETAIVLLVQLLVAGSEQDRMLDDVKERFKDDLRAALHDGSLTREDLATAKNDVAQLSREMAAIVREDIYTVTRLYEEVLDHTRHAVDSLKAHLGKVPSRGDLSMEEAGRLFYAMERSLVSLVSDHRFTLHAAATRSETPHERLLLEKRSEMLNTIFSLVRQERRMSSDRRSGRERRTGSGTVTYPGTERRSGKDRRSGKARRR